jgi:hypothetical protein
MVRGNRAFAMLRAGWIAFLLVTLFAFAWQSFVAQTHVHFGAENYAIGHAGKADALGRPKIVQPSAELPDECPICDEIAHAGHLLLPTSFALPAPETGTPLRGETPPFAQLPPARSHGWQSRAPPSLLQA